MDDKTSNRLGSFTRAASKQHFHFNIRTWNVAKVIPRNCDAKWCAENNYYFYLSVLTPHKLPAEEQWWHDSGE